MGNFFEVKNYGLDFSVLNDRLSFSVDYFIENHVGLFFQNGLFAKYFWVWCFRWLMSVK